MKTELFSISKIFTEKLLRIPDYQRGYAWTEKQLKDFWGDLLQVEKGQNHYVGVLTLEDIDKSLYSRWTEDEWIVASKNYEPYYIVDGQQRLTTIVILIQCILEKIGENEINYTKPYEIRKKFIFESKDGGISRSYLFGYDSDNPSYEFLKQNIFLEKSDSQYNLQETIYTNNLLKAKEFFQELLLELSIKEVETIYTKVTQNLLFNIYSMSKEIDVHVSFETMNNRGKQLSHLELLKNRLIYLSTKLNTDDFEKRSLRNSINECWKTIYHQLGRNKNNPLDDDEFLFNHFIIFYGESLGDDHLSYLRRSRRMRGFSSHYQDYLLEDKFTTKSLTSSEGRLTLPELYRYVSSIKSSVEKWYEISNPRDSSLDPEIVKWLEKIRRTGVEECMPLLMVSLQKISDNKLLVRFLKSLERLLFCFLLTGISYRIMVSTYMMENSIPSLFSEWASSLNSDNTSLEKIIIKIDDVKQKITESENLKQLSISFRDNGFYRWQGLRYFMYEYEQELKEASKSFTDKLSWSDIADDLRDHKTIEHIYPQTPRSLYWTEIYGDYNAKERSVIRHSLGNLVPLSQPKNSSFQNKPFPEKVGSSKNTIGFKYGSFSEIEIADNKQWTPVEVLNRNIKLLKFMEKRWGINFGGTDEMVKFSNLEFILKREGLIVEKNKIIKKE